jgi:pathogenesis-related protein 1
MKHQSEILLVMIATSACTPSSGGQAPSVADRSDSAHKTGAGADVPPPPPAAPLEAQAPSAADRSGSANKAGPGGDVPPPELAPLLDAQNRMREKHCTPPLAWSNKLAQTAQRWADTLQKRGCALEHSRSDYGENILGGTAGGQSPEGVAGVWYNEIGGYNFGKGSFSMKTGHFTQLVWVGSRHVGCGKATCKDREVWVCNYDPPGNVEGDYKHNVLPTSCR